MFLVLDRRLRDWVHIREHARVAYGALSDSSERRGKFNVQPLLYSDILAVSWFKVQLAVIGNPDLTSRVLSLLLQCTFLVRR